jgi:hypothetical protein
MPIETTIKPGDIITSDLIKAIILNLNRLEEEVGNLGGLNRVRIDTIDPDRRIGDLVNITGANFLHPPADNEVFVAGVRVTEFVPPGTSATITFRIPRAVSISDPDGEEVIIRIQSGEFGATEATYLLRPESTAPAIVITGVTNASDGSNTLETGEEAIVEGENLGTNTGAINITFEHGGSDHVVTDIVSAEPDGTEVRFTVPAIDTIPAPSPVPSTRNTTMIYMPGSGEVRLTKAVTRTS